MAVDAFLKLGSLKGESQVKGFEDQIEILSWNWDMTQQGVSHRGTGSGAGTANVSDLEFTHFIDAASPSLMQACLSGKHFDTATLTMRKVGGDTPLNYLVLTLSQVFVTKVATGGAKGGDASSSKGEEMVPETVALSFAKVQVDYQPQDSTGAKKGGTISTTYNIAQRNAG
jgi:type VI secretion system secreted protein Hcp